MASKGIRIERLLDAAAELLGIESQHIVGPSKERVIVKGRALVCYWAVLELGLSMTEVAQRIKIAVSTVSVAVKKGRQIVQDESLLLSELLNIKI